MNLRSASGGIMWLQLQFVYIIFTRAYTRRTYHTLTRKRTLISNISIRIDVTNVVIILLMSDRTL